jgi:hypothetical protein
MDNHTHTHKRLAKDMFVPDEPMYDYDGDDDDNTIGIRFKWLADNAKSIDDIVVCLQREMEWYKKLKEEGWELCGPVQDDYGWLRKKPCDHHVQEGAKRAKRPS